jgi:hypothetical protein
VCYDAYRDPLFGARARLEQRRREAASGEARLTPSFLARLPGELLTELAELRVACEAKVAEELADLARAEGLFAAYCAALEETIAREPDVDAAYRAMPDTVADPAPRGRTRVGLWWSSQHADELEEVTRALAAHLAGLDPGVRVVKTGPDRLSRVARFRFKEAPFSLRVELMGTDRPFCFALTLATSVPRAMPRLVLRPEGFLEAFFRSFGVRQIEVGDLAFDGLFVIDGPAGARLLTPAVRATLLELAYFDIPRLVVADGVATLSFSFDPTPACIGAAVRALLRMRALPV